jgi:hypothetical protein
MPRGSGLAGLTGPLLLTLKRQNRVAHPNAQSHSAAYWLVIKVGVLAGTQEPDLPAPGVAADEPK